MPVVWTGDPAFLHGRGGKTLFRSVPLLLELSLDGVFRKAAWLAHHAYGVVTTRMELALRVDFEEIVELVQPENYSKILGRVWIAAHLEP